MPGTAKKLAIRPAALDWLGDALKLHEVLDETSALEHALMSLPTITLEAWTAGQEILAEGEEGEDFFVVYTGRVSVLLSNGRPKPRKLGTLKPGDFFGEIGFLLKAARSASVRAETDAKIFRFPSAEFERLLRDNQGLDKWVNIVACKRLLKLFEAD
ncbi:MAG: cyclic nucleotide-binding domain-containing protein [Elusimicrobia bacterium]|nr:cyclic nucleotide-binding domain-containing protein [Elusimicrobiota bacterium]